MQERGRLFVPAGIYEGMIVGDRRRKATWWSTSPSRSSWATSVRRAPTRLSRSRRPSFTLEEALGIEDDELVEVTPQNIRLRKRMLSATDRRRLPGNNLSLVRMRPDQGAFLQEGNKASARANRRVYP
ncbi:MAG: hypothetical protein ACLT98_07995 [Eggerthellaceae bacterium]